MNAETVYYIHRRIIPAALDLLPGQMTSTPAKAMMLAIGLQESKFSARVQHGGGPAHGFWQFERGGGVHGVLTHPVTLPLILPVLRVLNYNANEVECYKAIVHNDVLAAVFTRLLLWTVPGSLPQQNQPQRGWQQYIDGWRPGKPHPATWPACFDEAWRTVTQED